ncbi:putative folic acid synthesis protein FOL1 [Plasmopara halstedii]
MAAPSACVYAALGTNLGEKVTNLENAVVMLTEMVGAVEATSCLYATAAQYVENQPFYYNIVIKIHTKLKAQDVLVAFKTIERKIGRTPTIRQSLHWTEGFLIIPHERIAERDFVLAPLCDLAPDLIHPVLKQPIRKLYATLQAKQQHVSPVPMLPIIKTSPWPLRKKTFIMGIVNVTPDSFSDGGGLDTVAAAVQKALDLERGGVEIIDIGGESSRPGADPVTLEEELRRVLPVIRRLRECSKVAISIDTTKADVAREAVKAGANLVNDISAGQNDSEMLATVAKLRVPMVLMHMRGTPKTMTGLKEYQDVVAEVSDDLKERIAAAEAAGIYRWNIILDPGIGFAKARVLNLKLLRNLSNVKHICHGLPLLIGSSRKRFIGEICGRTDPKDCVFGTAATCCAAIEQGVDILRVHDGAEMVDVAKMSDAIWREH